MWPFKQVVGVKELMEELESTKRVLRGLKSDVDDLWDRFRRLQGRLAKRGELSDTPQDTGTNGEGEQPTSSPLSPTFARLSPSQRRIQMEILARRRTVNGGS